MKSNSFERMTLAGAMFVALAGVLAGTGMAQQPEATTGPQQPPAAVTSPEAAPSAEQGASEVAQVPQASDARQAQATVRAVRGIVQYRTGDDQPWQRVEEGQTLDVGVEFRTGARSSVTFHLPPDQLVTLDRLGTLKLLDAVNDAEGSVAKTELGMQYGRTRYQVEGAQGVEHQATIRSPRATLAIRGTEDVTLTDQRPGPASASSKATRVTFRSKHTRTQAAFGSNKNQNRQSVEAGDTSPGQTANRKRVVDAGAAGARSKSEFRILNDFELYNGSQLTSQGIRGIVTSSGAAAPSQPSEPGGCCCGGGGHYGGSGKGGGGSDLGI